jgi:hypothetical protein
MSNDPLPPPATIAYAGRDPHAIDASHLGSLSMCHFIWGGLLALFACFPIMHIVIGVMFMTGGFPTTSPASPTPPPFDPRLFGLFFVVFGAVFVLLGWLLAGFTIASGFFIRRRRRRMWSVVIAAINCAIFPFGTVLGVFTLMVLLRDSVRVAYEESKRPA